ncbi:MAG: glycosyltransferase family 39 protein [Planctomycetota bacterium]|nr:glycosyltransferase family 39 protein [Planctomycetota bacterium]
MRSLLTLQTYLLLFGALIFRIVKTFLVTVVARDSVVYIQQTGAFSSGDWNTGLSAYYPPLYAVLSAAIALFIGPHFGALVLSVIAGAALVLPFRVYAKNFLSERALFAASLLILLTPSLVTCSAEILAESVYLFVFMTIVALLYEQQKQRAIGLSILLGFLAGALTLIRPEGIVIILGAAFLCGRRGQEEERRSVFIRACCIALVLLTSLTVIAPYSYYLKQESGRWTFTKKEGTVIGGLAKFSEAQNTPVAEIHEHFQKENDALADTKTPRSAKKDLTDLLSSRPMLFLKKSVHGFGQCLLLIPRVSHWVLFLLACPGLFLLGRARRWPWELTVLLALHILVISTVTPQKRYLLPFVLLVCLGAGVSLDAVAPRLRRLHKRGYGAVLGILLLVLGISAFKVERRGKGIVRELARALVEEKVAARVASIESRVAYYAGVEDQPLPRFASKAELKRFLVQNEISYLCFRDNWRERWCPWMKIEDIGEVVASRREGRTQLLLIRVRLKD